MAKICLYLCFVCAGNGLNKKIHENSHNQQARTRESEEAKEYKAEARKVKPHLKPVNLWYVKLAISRSRISQRVDKNSQRVDLLMGDRMTLQETVWTVEEEAYAARVAWNHSIGLSQETYQELQTHRDHVYAYTFRLSTQLQLQRLSFRHTPGDGRHADRVVILARAVEEGETARTGCYTPRSPGGYWELGESHLAVRSFSFGRLLYRHVKY
ncbi:hypothetical protein Tco_0545359 [Tanacetum coccineum]